MQSKRKDAYCLILKQYDFFYNIFVKKVIITKHQKNRHMIPFSFPVLIGDLQSHIHHQQRDQ